MPNGLFQLQYFICQFWENVHSGLAAEDRDEYIFSLILWSSVTICKTGPWTQGHGRLSRHSSRFGSRHVFQTRDSSVLALPTTAEMYFASLPLVSIGRHGHVTW